MSETEQSREIDPLAPRRRAGLGRWWITGVLFLATVLTYLDRQTVAVCSEDVCKEFGLDEEQYGVLLSSFRWAYALMQLPAGVMADRLPLATTYGLAVGLWSLAGAAAANARSFRPLMITRAVLGMGESFNWPCASRIVANSFPPSDRSLASGIFNSGAAIGSLIAPMLIGGLIAQRFGWRAAFFTMGALGFLWLIFWVFATRGSGPCCLAVEKGPHYSLRGQAIYCIVFLAVGVGVPAVVILYGPRMVAPFRETAAAACEAAPLLPAVLFWGFCLGMAGLAIFSLIRWRARAVAFGMLLIVTLSANPCWYFVNDWLMKYLRERRQLNVETAAFVATLVFLVADLGNVVSGGVIKYLVARRWSLRAARSAVMVVIAGMVAPATLLATDCSVPVTAVLFAMVGMGLTAIIANSTACQQDFVFARVGLVSGCVGMAANLVSAVAYPQIGAHIRDTQSYALPFVLLGVLPLISVAAILVFDTLVHRHSPQTGVGGSDD